MKYSGKDRTDRNRHESRIKRSGQAGLLTTSPREGEPVGDETITINRRGFYSLESELVSRDGGLFVRGSNVLKRQLFTGQHFAIGNSCLWRQSCTVKIPTPP